MELERRSSVSLTEEPAHRIYVTSPEDIVLAKLEWYRLGNEISDRQWMDILGVLRVKTGDLDLKYMHKWADELSVSDLLERALQEA